MVRVSKCCCCFPVKTGAYIIGFAHVIGLLLGIVFVNPLQVTLEVFCGITFLWMFFRDSEQKRLFYFSAYCVYVGILFVFRLIFSIWDHDENEFVENFCSGTEKNLREAGADWA